VGDKIRNLFSRHLVADSDGVTISAIGDYSSAEEIFLLRPASGVILEMTRLLVTIEDTGNLVDAKYGDNSGALLTNGINVGKYNADGVIESFTTGNAIKTNPHWGRFCYDYSTLAKNSSPIGNVRWTFEKMGAPLRLYGSLGEFFGVSLNDSFTFLTGHSFVVQGFIRQGSPGFATDALA
jgi:hypothetical protein